PGTGADETDDARAGGGTPSVSGSCPHDACQIPAGNDPAWRLLEIEHLAAVEGSRPDGDEGLVREGLGIGRVGERDPRRRPGCEERTHHENGCGSSIVNVSVPRAAHGRPWRGPT